MYKGLILNIRVGLCDVISSSSSSASVQGSVILLHYHTLEVRPGSISEKLDCDYDSKEMM